MLIVTHCSDCIIEEECYKCAAPSSPVA